MGNPVTVLGTQPHILPPQNTSPQLNKIQQIPDRSIKKSAMSNGQNRLNSVACFFNVLHVRKASSF